MKIIVLFLTLSIFGFAEQNRLVHPPQRFTRAQIAGWVAEIVQEKNRLLTYRLVDTEEWQRYVNEEHFVPLTLEGVAPNFRFDYSWQEKENPRRRLPRAEVTETGEFVLWWNYCNYDQLTETACRNQLRTTVAHEVGHFTQWQRIAVTLRTAFRGDFVKDEGSEVLPVRLPQLANVNGLRDAFLQVWTNPSHYQCREVEVYTNQIENGEISVDVLGRDGFLARVRKLHIYTYGSSYSPGCATSRWRVEFSAALQKAERIFRANQLPLERMPPERRNQ